MTQDIFMFSVLNSVETIQYSITTPENISVLIVYEKRLFWWFVDILAVSNFDLYSNYFKFALR